MYYFFLLSAMVALASSKNDGDNYDRIVGGQETTIKQHPYQVSIEILRGGLKPVHHCGGALIKPDVVLTAAHCMQLPFHRYTIRAGSTYVSNGGQNISVLYYINHHKYVNLTVGFDYDVSIIKLKKQFRVNRWIKIILLLPEDKKISDGEVAVVTGWGSLFEFGPSSKVLRQVEVLKYNQNRCKQIFFNLSPTAITNRMTCYGIIPGGQDACEGDSGGALVVGRYVAGIVSWGTGCGLRNRPGIYASLENYEIRRFIYSNL